MSQPVTEGLLEPFGYGRGFPDYLAPAAPAAGAGLVLGLDARYAWRFVSVRFVLTTDANAANRFPSVDYCDPDGNVWVRNGAGLVVTASTTNQEFDFSVGRMVAEWAANTPVLAPLADTFVLPGWQLRINLANVQVGDQLSAIRCYVEKFPTGPRGYPSGRIGASGRRGLPALS